MHELILEWMRARVAETESLPGAAGVGAAPAPGRQGMLWTSAPYQDDAPAIRTRAEFDGALEHLEYAVFRRYQNELTRAERARLDNTIKNGLFKLDRYLERLDNADRPLAEGRVEPIRASAHDGRERVERPATRPDAPT